MCLLVLEAKRFGVGLETKVISQSLGAPGKFKVWECVQ